MEKSCRLCGRAFSARRSDQLYCGAKCRWEAFYVILHPGRSRRGGQHRPRLPRQPETQKGSMFAAGSYFDLPTLSGFDEKAD